MAHVQISPFPCPSNVLWRAAISRQRSYHHLQSCILKALTSSASFHCISEILQNDWV
uniref:Uncharacterized protein n=1 Tax=Rhizophora mucronata TaxID=61149 RepID=A0A2P2QCU5_RHIMU